ncbi:MAG: DUF1992 domain-containing protein [Pseudomonadales bacterium]|nr:DUF1992 domain-containing protein [Pseudomonadales bacterium]
MAHTDDIIGGWISNAEKTGEVKKLPGYGKPLDLDDDSHVPRKYRMAYRVLKNANITPPEVEMIRELGELREQLAQQTDKRTRSELSAKIREAKQKLDIALDKFKFRQ